MGHWSTHFTYWISCVCFSGAQCSLVSNRRIVATIESKYAHDLPCAATVYIFFEFHCSPLFLAVHTWHTRIHTFVTFAKTRWIYIWSILQLLRFRRQTITFFLFFFLTWFWQMKNYCWFFLLKAIHPIRLGSIWKFRMLTSFRIRLVTIYMNFSF